MSTRNELITIITIMIIIIITIIIIIITIIIIIIMRTKILHGFLILSNFCRTTTILEKFA